jgi:hypothetical protein
VQRCVKPLLSRRCVVDQAINKTLVPALRSLSTASSPAALGQFQK